jgi:DNA-binding transcriptional regulator YhcF (GntR family)
VSLCSIVHDDRTDDRGGGDRDAYDRACVPPATPARSLPGLLEQRLRIALDSDRLISRTFEELRDEAIMSSTMFRVNLRRDKTAPDLHTQVAATIRRAIADGEAAPGDRLPPAQDLAAELGVDRNTALRALRSLRDEGLVDFTRGRGVTVTGTTEDGALIEQARDLIALAHRFGYGVDELIQLIRRADSTAGT